MLHNCSLKLRNIASCWLRMIGEIDKKWKKSAKKQPFQAKDAFFSAENICCQIKKYYLCSESV